VDYAAAGEHGWWFRLISKEFRFLIDEYAYSISSVEPHFRGDFVSYSGSSYTIHHAYSEDARIVLCEFVIQTPPGTAPLVLPVWSLLQARDPTKDWRPPDRDHPLTRRLVTTTTRRWALGLRTLAGDVLRGARVTDAVWYPMWTGESQPGADRS
jgi:hypothetical protein